MTAQITTPQTHVVLAGDVTAATSGPALGEVGRSEVAATTTRTHGTRSRYNDGCRCAPCRGENSRYMQRRDLLVASGRWEPLTDATPVRAHLEQLRLAGLGVRPVARLAGVSPSVVRRIVSGEPSKGIPPLAQVRPATARAILAVRLEIDDPNTTPHGVRTQEAAA